MSKRREMRLNHEGHFSKIAETAHWASSEWAPRRQPIQNIPYNSYSYSFNFNGGLRKRRTGFCLLRTPIPKGKQFLWFLKIDLLQFHRIYLLFDWSKLLFFWVCLIRINLPNLCPNIIHVDAVDFSECHSKEVISFFWRSVYNDQSDFGFPYFWGVYISSYSLNKKEWICSLFKEWILEKSEIRVNLEWT